MTGDVPAISAAGDARLMREESVLELPATKDGILQLVRRVLTKPHVEAIRITEQGVRVVWRRAMHDGLDVTEPVISMDEILARVDILEIPEQPTSHDTVHTALLTIASKRLFPSHVLVGSMQKFRDWLGIPSVLPFQEVEGTGYLNYLGLLLAENTLLLPEGAVVILASGFRGAELSEVDSAVKIVI